jgi:hypothetical protein
VGRKKNVATTEAQPEAAVQHTNGNGTAPTTLSGAIVKALETMGADAETPAVKAWITQNYPGFDVGAASFQSTLSLKRKAAREGDATTPRKKAAAPASKPGPKPKPVAVVASAEPTLSDLLRVKEAADGQGGVDALLKAVQSVRVVADQVGGIDKLAASLEALQKLGGGK